MSGFNRVKDVQNINTFWATLIIIIIITVITNLNGSTLLAGETKLEMVSPLPISTLSYFHNRDGVVTIINITADTLERVNMRKLSADGGQGVLVDQLVVQHDPVNRLEGGKWW